MQVDTYSGGLLHYEQRYVRKDIYSETLGQNKEAGGKDEFVKKKKKNRLVSDKNKNREQCRTFPITVYLFSKLFFFLYFV